MAFDQLSQTPPPPQVGSRNLNICNLFFILMDYIHFKTDFSMTKQYIFSSLLPSFPYYSVSKLYYTYYNLRLLMMVCILLIWFILTVLQESSNLGAIFIVCRKINNKISKLVLLLTPPPFFGQKPTLFSFFLNTSFREEFQKKCKNMVFDHNWGGGSAQTIPLLQNSIVFENIIYIFNYMQFIVVPK